MLLKKQNRQNQTFLIRIKPTHSFFTAFCQFYDSPQQKPNTFSQETIIRQKISLKRYRPSINFPSQQVKIQLDFSLQLGNSKKIKKQGNIQSMNESNLCGKLTSLNPRFLQINQQGKSIGVSMCKSQSCLAANHNPWGTSLPINYSHTNLDNSGMMCSPIRKDSILEMMSIKENEKMQHTTCMELKSQDSFPQYFGKPISPSKIPESTLFQSLFQKQGEIAEGEDQWSDESLSSETKVRFNHIDEEQSISESCSTRQKNKVVVNHNTHPTLLHEFRKAHTIRSNISHEDDNFSDHSIVLDRQHNYFLTPGRKFERNQAWHFGHTNV